MLLSSSCKRARCPTSSWGLLVGLILAISQAGWAHAQTTATPDTAAQGLLRQEQRQQETQSLLPPGPDALHSTAPASETLGELPAESPCFVISSIHLTGARSQRLSWLAHDLQPVFGQCVGVKGLDRIASALDAHLIALGYATSRVSFPPQDLRDGVLTIHLDVGTVAAVRMENAQGQPDTAWGTWRNAFPTGAGDILNIRDLEQGIEQMDRLQSQSVHTQIIPGSAPNSSVIVLQRQEAPFVDRLHGGVTLDNSGNRLLGRPALSAALSLDNPLGLNDILALTANSNVENPSSQHRSQSAGINYSVPWGYSLLSLSAQTLRYAQLVQGTTAQFLSSGRAHTQQLRLDATIWRTASTKIGVFSALMARQSKSYLDDVELVVQRRNTLNLDAGLNVTMALPAGGRLGGAIDYRRGLASFGAQQDLPTAEAGGLTVRPRITSATLSWVQPFRAAGGQWQYAMSLRGQTTPDTLVTEDQFSIGDRSTVRGFDGNTVLLAENGYTVRNNLSRQIDLVPGWASVAYVGLDYGRVWGPSAANLIGTRLAGTAVGLKGQHGHLQFDVALATPLLRPSGFQTQHLNLYAAATVAF